MSGSLSTPGERELAPRIYEMFAREFENALGFDGLGGVRFDGDDDEVDPDPWIVIDREGRRFEVSWEVDVVELTPELEASRAKFMASFVRRYGAQAAAVQAITDHQEGP